MEVVVTTGAKDMQSSSQNVTTNKPTPSLWRKSPIESSLLVMIHRMLCVC